MRPNLLARALAPTILFGGTLGTLIGVTVFGVSRIINQMLEAVGLIPLRWGENNLDVLANISIFLTLPVVIWFVWWFYGKARDAEARLKEYIYTPPE